MWYMYGAATTIRQTISHTKKDDAGMVRVEIAWVFLWGSDQDDQCHTCQRVGVSALP